MKHYNKEMLKELGRTYPFFLNFGLKTDKKGNVETGVGYVVSVTENISDMELFCGYHQITEEMTKKLIHLAKTTEKLKKYLSITEIEEYLISGSLPVTDKTKGLKVADLKPLMLDWFKIPNECIHKRSFYSLCSGPNSSLHETQVGFTVKLPPEIREDLKKHKEDIIELIALHAEQEVDMSGKEGEVRVKVRQKAKSIVFNFAEFNRYGQTYPFYLNFGFRVDEAGEVVVDEKITMDIWTTNEELDEFLENYLLDEDVEKRLRDVISTYEHIRDVTDHEDAVAYLTTGIFPPGRVISVELLNMLKLPFYSVRQAFFHEPCPGSTYAECVTTFYSKHKEKELLTYPPEHLVEFDSMCKYLTELTRCMVDLETPVVLNPKTAQTLINWPSSWSSAKVNDLPKVDHHVARVEAIEEPEEDLFEMKFHTNEELNTKVGKSIYPQTLPRQQLAYGYGPGSHTNQTTITDGAIGGILFSELSAGFINTVTSEQLTYLRRYINEGKLSIELVKEHSYNLVLFKAIVKL